MPHLHFLPIELLLLVSNWGMYKPPIIHPSSAEKKKKLAVLTIHEHLRENHKKGLSG